jgi:hypothetical protein
MAPRVDLTVCYKMATFEAIPTISPFGKMGLNQFQYYSESRGAAEGALEFPIITYQLLQEDMHNATYTPLACSY